jgi:hypothetical protein
MKSAVVAGFRLVFTVLGAASLFTVVAGSSRSEVADTFRSDKSASAQGASPGRYPLTPNWAGLALPRSPRELQQSTKPIVTVQSLPLSEPQVPSEARPEAPSPLVVAPGSDVRPVEAPAAAAVPSTPGRRGPAPTEVAAYIALARAKIQQGDIAAARRLLERAAESDEGVAIFVLAETYDPQILARWGVLGVKPDLEKARALYEKAETRGVQGAKERLLAIRK